MTAAAFRAALAALDIDQWGAAALLHQNTRTVRRWTSGETEVPVPVALALRLMLREGIGWDEAWEILYP